VGIGAQAVTTGLAVNVAQEEIAAAMGLTVPAVKSLLFRARDNLRAAIAPYLEQTDHS
jgi:DNA-directed RNA polymerase specialized sigma24 family protein